MLHKYKPGDNVSAADAADLSSLLERHPDSAAKIGMGIHHFEVQAADYSSQCFRVVRPDGTWARFSYKACIAPSV
ncbi:DCL family protein [Bradyrhizobium japonicum]|uniref:DCL family protein n=1 Tax=Bradyrhizobium japonicum TaxID=375 RepID=UPI0020138064|nr:DCL family protein [Bradyrhizobium japonicum]